MGTFQYAGPISSDTLRVEDLLPRFCLVARAMLCEGYGRFHDCRVDADMLEDIECRMVEPDFFRSEEAGWFMDDLFELLEEICPEGWWFGSQEGDGACFGFWEVESECDECGERYFGAPGPDGFCSGRCALLSTEEGS